MRVFMVIVLVPQSKGMLDMALRARCQFLPRNCYPVPLENSLVDHNM